MKSIVQLLIFIYASLLCIPKAIAAEWDGNSPKWVGVWGCAEKIKFSVMDKLSTSDKYDVEYRVWWSTSEKKAYVLKKSYTTNAADANAVFPDDFHQVQYEKLTGETKLAPTPCRDEKIFWSTYVNGKKIADGFIWSKVNHFEVNGKLISIERK